MTHLSPFEKRPSAGAVRGTGVRPSTRRQVLIPVFALVAACTSASRGPATPAPRGATASPSRAEPAQEPMPEAIEPEQAAEEPELVDEEPQPNASFANGSRFGETVCGSTRPQVCNAAPSPVCARLKSRATTETPAGERTATYVNGCLACADPSVIDYARGRCKPR